MTESIENINTASDLVLKQILLSIEDDNVFTATCSTNKRFANVCTHPDLWEARLNKYFPWSVNYRLQTGCNWADYYVLVSLVNQFLKIDNVYTEFNKKQNDVLDQLGRYAADIDIEYKNIFNKDFLALFPNTIVNKPLQAIYKYLIQNIVKNGNIKSFRNLPSLNLKKYDFFTRDKNHILCEFGSAEFILLLTVEDKLIELIRDNIKIMNQKKIIALLQGYIKNNNNVYYFDFDSLMHTLFDHMKGRVVDFILENFVVEIKIQFSSEIKINSNDNNSNFKREKINSSKVLTKLLLFAGENYQNTLTYMISRKIRPEFENLLPTLSFVKTLDPTDDEIDDDNDEDNLVASNSNVKEKNKDVYFQRYIYHHNSDNIEDILEQFVFANIVPNASILDDIPSFEINKDDNEFDTDMHRIINRIRNKVAQIISDSYDN